MAATLPVNGPMNPIFTVLFCAANNRAPEKPKLAHIAIPIVTKVAFTKYRDDIVLPPFGYLMPLKTLMVSKVGI
jgi:hypothetical protein